MIQQLSIALLVISDRASTGERGDKCEPAIRGFIEERGYSVNHTSIVADETDQIQAAITKWADQTRVDLILTAGGTGLSPRDITPEATRSLLDRDIPGIPEAMRSASMKITPYAMLSRGLAGLRKNSMIVNLPGSPKAAVENLATVFDALMHGVAKAQGDPSDCKPLAAQPEHSKPSTS